MIILLTWYVAHASGKQGNTHKVQYIIKHHKKQISSKVNTSTLVRHYLSPVSGERTNHIRLLYKPLMHIMLR